MNLLQRVNVQIVFYFLFSVFLFWLDKGGRINFVHSWVHALTAPIAHGLYTFSGRIHLSPPFQKSANLEELQRENALFQAEIASLKSVQEENGELRRLLDAPLPANWKFSPARVVSIVGDSLFISSDAPQSRGVAVISVLDQNSKSGVYIGRTEDIKGDTVEVVLATSTKSKIPVSIRNAKTFDKVASGIAVGRGGRILLDQVLSGETLREGDLVLTSGEAGTPADLLIGTNSKVLGSNLAFQQAEVQQAADPKKLDYVFLVTKF